MQNRYAGDIGDFIKLALLRALQPGHRLGVAWWLFPDESHNGDGRHIGYLQQPEKWRGIDSKLFDGLGSIVAADDRRVAALQEAQLLPGAVFCDDLIPIGTSPATRRAARQAWFDKVQADLDECDLVFLDPDNGLETANFSLGAVAAGKCVSLGQLAALAPAGRTLVVYHHHTRRKGGHLAELAYWADRLHAAGFASVDAVRSHRYSPRAFFLLNATPELRARARILAASWSQVLSWHPDPALAAAEAP